MNKSAIAKIIGEPRRVDAEMQEFRKNARMLSSSRASLIAKYPKQWIAIYGREVKASGGSLKKVLEEVDRLKLPRNRVVIRYIERTARRMVL